MIISYGMLYEWTADCNRKYLKDDKYLVVTVRRERISFFRQNAPNCSIAKRLVNKFDWTVYFDKQFADSFKERSLSVFL